MAPTDAEILTLLARSTSAEAGPANAVLTEQLLDAAPSEPFAADRMKSILLAAGFAEAAHLATQVVPSATVLLWKKVAFLFGAAAGIAGLFWMTYRPTPPAEGLTRYSTSPPEPIFVSSPLPVVDAPNLEPIPPSQYTFDAPPGARNLASGAKLTSSANLPASELQKLTDDQKGSHPATEVVSTGFGKQSITLDLGKENELFALVMWHRFDTLITYRDVLVETSTSPDFAKPIILYNNDHDNTLGRGIGTQRGYLESNFGRVIPLLGEKARWVRIWSNGSQVSEENHYAEIQVWGR